MHTSDTNTLKTIPAFIIAAGNNVAIIIIIIIIIITVAYLAF